MKTVNLLVLLLTVLVHMADGGVQDVEDGNICQWDVGMVRKLQWVGSAGNGGGDDVLQEPLKLTTEDNAKGQ